MTDRTKEALDYVMATLKEARWCGPINYATITAKVKDILNPAPIIEEIEEIVGWVNVYQREDGGVFSSSVVYASEEIANSHVAPGVNVTLISCQPIRVTVKREKKRPVERSVTVECKMRRDGVIEVFCETPIQPFMQHPDTYGKTGTLTFTWNEDPTT